MTKLLEIKILTNVSEMFDPKINKSQRLWSINISDKGGSQQRGDVTMFIKDEDGNDIQIMLPSTWLPIDLTQFAPINLFSKSTTFRNYLRSRLIGIVSDDVAAQLLNRPDAAAEKTRVSREISSMQNAPALHEVGGGESVKLNIGAGGVQVSRVEDEAIQKSSSADLMQGNTPALKAILAKVANAQPADMEAVHPELVGFLVSATDAEIKALAAGLSSHTSPVYDYTDAALNAMAEGSPVTADLFASLRDAATSRAPAENISFAVP